MGETTPLVGAYSIVRGGPRSRPGCRLAANWAADFGLLLLGLRLLQPARDYREPGMFVVVVDHLLDVVVDVIVVLLVVADALPVPKPVATVGNGAGDGRDSLSLDPDTSCPALTRWE